MTTDRLKQALMDPESVFSSPEDVAESADLTRDQKIEILQRWEYNAAEEAVALEEGMPGEESDLLRRILIVLGNLAGPLDLTRTGPAKQHGLPRSAIVKPDEPDVK